MTNNNKNKNKNITNNARCRSDRWRPEFPLVPPSADRTSFSVKAERKTKRKTTREEEEKTNQLANGKKRRYNHVCALVFHDLSYTYCLFHGLCTKAREWLSFILCFAQCTNIYVRCAFLENVIRIFQFRFSLLVPSNSGKLIQNVSFLIKRKSP